MRAAAAACVEHGVAIGAHVSYRDRGGFGRRDLDVGPDRLAADAIDALARSRTSVGAAVSDRFPTAAGT
jgi:UPF0271 protein